MTASPSSARAIITYDVRSKGAEAYMSLAREIIER